VSIPKFAVVSHTVPPSTGGQSALIHRLLADLDPGGYCLISHGVEEAAVMQETLPRLPGRYHDLPAEHATRFGTSKILRGLLLAAALRSRAKSIARIVREEGCEAVVAFTGDLLNLPASALASRTAWLPYYVYVCDYYSNQWVNPVLRLAARRMEPWLMRGAAGVIVPNDFMRAELRRRFGIEAHVICHSCDLAQYGAAPARFEDSAVSVVYTGAVSPAQSDALQNLLQAVALVDERPIDVHVYTGQSRAVLEQLGVHGRFAHHGHEPLSSMPAVQKQSDILFLPLSFESPYPELIRTASPFKMSEYLASRRPILVHAPPDCFLSWYFRRYECGLVVDQPDPKMLAESIVRLASDEILQEGLSARAWERARLDFDSERARRSFLDVLSTG